MSSVAAKAVAQNLSPLGQGAATPSATDSPTAIRDVEGNGGKIFVEQLKSAGVEYIFFNPSTGDHPIFDALVDVPEITLIKGVQEGAVVAMADGYARASGRTGVVVVANIGLPNAMTQMVNSWRATRRRSPSPCSTTVTVSERNRIWNSAGAYTARAHTHDAEGFTSARAPRRRRRNSAGDRSTARARQGDGDVRLPDITLSASAVV